MPAKDSGPAALFRDLLRPAGGLSHRQFLLGFAVMLAGLAVAPSFVYPILLMKILCYALFACSLNLVFGFAGLLSFGHAAFYGAAAYAAAHASKVWGFPPELSLLFAMAVAGVLGWVFGVLAVRRTGLYFAMITLAFAQMVYFFAVQAPFTHGEDGIQSVPRGTLFGLFDLSDNMTLYWFVLAVFAGGFLAIYRVINSPFGEAIAAIKDHEQRATSIGYRANSYKLTLFVIAAVLAGAAGATKTLVFELASLSDVHWSTSGEALLMTLIGGVGSFFGPVFGATAIVVMQNYLADLRSWVFVAQGVVFVLCVMFLRGGLVRLFSRT